MYLSHGAHYDFKEQLYMPLRQSNLVIEHEIYFSHETDGWVNTKEIIEKSDIVVAEVSEAGTGIGIELGWANSARKPVIAIYKNGISFSRSIKAVTENIVSYDQGSLVEVIEQEVDKLRG